MGLLLGVVILIFSAILHEIMHGWVAYKLGDPTAKHMGRLTLNPLPHIDPVMSIIIPFILVFFHSPIIFGAAKPVPVNPFNLHDGKKDYALVALAGPLTNLILAGIGALIAHLFFPGIDFLYIISLAVRGIFEITSPYSLLLAITALLIYYNLVLGFLNLIPIPPLDGSKVVSFLLPDDIAKTYLSLESYGFVILFILLSFPVGGISLGQILSNLVYFSIHLLGL